MRVLCAVQTIHNMFVLVPNMVGGAMSLLALLVCIVLPRQACLQSPHAEAVEQEVLCRVLSSSATIHARH